MSQRCRRSLILLCAANAIDPPKRAVFDLEMVGVCGQVDRVHTRLRTLVLFEMGAVRHFDAAVRYRVLRSGAVASTRARIGAWRFARFCVGTLVRKHPRKRLCDWCHRSRDASIFFFAICGKHPQNL